MFFRRLAGDEEEERERSASRVADWLGMSGGGLSLSTVLQFYKNFGVVLFSVFLVVKGFTEIKKTPK